MAVDNRPFKSKEQDGQGNEVIIRDQQLVEQGTATTMPAGTYFQTLDVDGRPVKIPKDNMLNLIVEGLGIIFNGQSDQQTVTKVPTLNGNNFGASTVATLASVLGGLWDHTMAVQANVSATTTFGLGNGIWLFGPAGPGGYNPAAYTECAVFIIKKTTQTAAKSIEILSYSWFDFSNLSLSGDPVKLQFTTTLSGNVGFRRLL